MFRSCRSTVISLLSLLLLWSGEVCHAQQLVLTPDALFQGMQRGIFDAVVDVRSLEEWNAGHVANATLVENLSSTGSPDALRGCETCTLVIVCRSGSRAAAAITRLETEFGFNGTLYNGLGISQWTGLGYSLVTTPSLTPPCSTSATGICVPSLLSLTARPAAAPTMSAPPSSEPSASAAPSFEAEQAAAAMATDSVLRPETVSSASTVAMTWRQILGLAVVMPLFTFWGLGTF